MQCNEICSSPRPRVQLLWSLDTRSPAPSSPQQLAVTNLPVTPDSSSSSLLVTTAHSNPLLPSDAGGTVKTPAKATHSNSSPCQPLPAPELLVILCHQLHLLKPSKGFHLLQPLPVMSGQQSTSSHLLPSTPAQHRTPPGLSRRFLEIQ